MNDWQGVLFDLDGTLVDTAPDLAAALNRLRAAYQLPEMAFREIRPWVSHGGAALIKLGFAHINDAQQLEALRQEFLKDYQNNLAEHSRLFNGMEKVLLWLQQNHYQWGIVTNKPSWLTEPLLQQLDFPYPYTSLICGDTLAEKKPHPLPLLTACKDMGLTSQQCLYIGDAQRDIEAAINANMQSVVACYGYIDKDENWQQWQADYAIEQAEDLLAILAVAN